MIDGSDQEYNDRQQLELFQQAVEQAADGVAILENETYVYIDQTHVDMYGFENKDQLLGSSWRRLYDDAEVERIEAEAFPKLAQTGHWRGKVTGSRPDGSTFPAELSLSVVDDGRLVCTVRDQTETEARKRELELKERAINEATVGIQITDPTQAHNPLTYVNSGFEQITGYTKEEAIGRNPRFLNGKDTDPGNLTEIREAIENERSISLELQNYRKDGTPYWNRLSVTPVTDGSGTVTNFIGIQQDVTERRERSQWLEEFLNSGPLMFAKTREVDGAAIIESCNDGLIDRLGYDQEDLIGTDLRHIYSEESASELQERGYIRALEGGFETTERCLVTAANEQVDTLLRAVPRRDGTIGTNALFIDITESKTRERKIKKYVALLERIHEVTTNTDISFEEKITELLEAGSEYLSLPHGFLTHVEMERESSFGTQTIVEAAGSHEFLKPGTSHALSRSYCRRTIDKGEPLLISDASTVDQRKTDPEYDSYGFETYIGGTVIAGEGTYGTLYFAANEPREVPFDVFEESFISVLSRWVGYEIHRRETGVKLRHRQDQIREQRQINRAVTDVSFDLHFRIDLNGRLSYISPAAAQLLDRPIANYADRPIDIFSHSETAEDVQKAYERVLTGETVELTALPIERGTAGRVFVDLRLTPIYDHDTVDDDRSPENIIGAQGVARDVSGRHRREQMIRVLNRVLRHNLRNEINVIDGYLKLLQPQLTGENAVYARRITDATDRLASLGETARKLESDLDMTQAFEPEDVVGMVTRVAEQVVERHQNVLVFVDTTDPISAQCDSRLEPALWELLDNAARYGGDEPTIRVKISSVDGCVNIRILDDGPGLPDEERRILSMNHETPLEHSDGFGLWLVQWIVESLGGELNVLENRPGACLEIRLQRPEADG